MVRIANKEIPENKNISVSLTYIYGIGRPRAGKIVEKCGINPHIKTKNLDEKQIKEINRTVEEYMVEGKLKEVEQGIISNQIRLGLYRGLRRLRKLPLRGQRTRHNAQTAKKGGAATRKKVAVAGKKKAPSPK
jgi:small subunit ribosomal protein S13